jgi:hypothetical protein
MLESSLCLLKMLQIRGIITLKNQEASSLMKIFNGMNEELDKCTCKVKAKVADNWTIVNTMQLTTSNRNKMSCDVYSCLSSCRKSDTAFDPKEVNYIVKSQFANKLRGVVITQRPKEFTSSSLHTRI